ncbi:WD repeat-containing protein [Aphanomyces cochlioides]|nr:WD repeat-containing protein [Aphanomyces cochlioides]
MPTPQQAHQEKVEKRLREKLHVGDALEDSSEHAKINEMVARVAKLAAEDSLREDGFFFADGKYMCPRVYKPTPGMVNRSFTGHVKPVHIVRPLHDGTHLVTIGMDKVCLWSMGSPEPISSVDRSDAIASPNLCFISGDVAKVGRNIAVCAGLAPKSMKWDQSALTPETCGVYGHDDVITCSSLSPDGSVLATASMDTCCILWDVETMQLLYVLHAHHGGVSWCGFSSDGQRLLTCGMLDHEIKSWDIAQYLDDNRLEELRTIATNNPTKQKILNGGHPADEAQSGTKDLVQEQLDDNMETTLNGTEVIKLPKLISPTDVQENETQNKLPPEVSSSMDTESVLNTPEIGTRKWSERQKYNRAIDAIFSPEVTLDVLTQGNIMPQLCFNDDWFFNRQKPHHELKLPPLYTYMDPENGKFAVREEFDDPLKLAQLETIDILSLLDPSSSILPSCELVKFDANDIPNDTPVVIFENKTIDKIFVRHTHTINAMASLPASDIVVSVASDKCVKFWQLSTGIHIYTLREAHTLPILTCAISSHDTHFLATGSSDSFVKIWNPTTYDCIFTLRGHFDSVLSVAFSPSGHSVYSASLDTQIIKWQVIPTEPDTPAQPNVIKIDCHAIEIAWKEPLGNGAKIEKYKIRISKMNGPFEPPFDVPEDETKFLVQLLDPGCLYSFCVAAVNRVGCSEFSVPTTPVETLAYRPFKIKKPCTIMVVETRSVTLEWIIPNANGARITNYHFRCIPEDPSEEEATAKISLSAETIEREIRAKEELIQAEINRKAQAREERRAAFEAKRVKRNSKRSEAKEVVKKKTKQKKPREALGENENTQTLTRPTPTTLTVRLDCLKPGIIYQFAIAPENRCGVGDFSIPSSYIKTISCEPDPPLTPTITKIASHSIELTWVKPRHNGSEILHYTLQWKQDGYDVQTLILMARNLATTTHKISPLAAGRVVKCRVGASNVIDKKLRDSLFSEWSDGVKTLPSVPDAPEAAKLLEPTSHTLVARFTAPCDNGKPILRYHALLFIEEDSYGVVTRRLYREIIWSLDMLNECSGSYQIGLVELRAGKRHVLSVAAENELGKGDFSQVSIGISTKQATVPATIMEPPTVFNLEPTKLELRWTTPAHDGGSALLGYSINYSMNGAPFENDFRVQKLATTLTVDFLKPKTTYSFEVAGVNSAGIAVFSPPSEPVLTPSLVEHTLQNYFRNRPPEEHSGAKRIQNFYRQTKRRAKETTQYTAYMRQCLDNWNFL